MRLRFAALLLAVALCCPAAAMSDDAAAAPSGQRAIRDPGILAELTYLVEASNVASPTGDDVRDVMNHARGGNQSGQEAGCYSDCSPDFAFKSPYGAVPAETQSAWAYDFRRFILLNQGGQQDVRTGHVQVDGLPPYRMVRDSFAMAWWKGYPAFDAMLPPSQKAFLFDAIVDGANVSRMYERLLRRPTTTELLDGDIALHTYRNTPVVEIFF